MVDGVMSAPLLSAIPVEIPIASLPPRFRPPEGESCILVDGAQTDSGSLTTARFRVTMRDHGNVTVEAWSPWVRPAPGEFPSCTCFLTPEGIGLLGSGDPGVPSNDL
jgi:hypothetical protein